MKIAYNLPLLVGAALLALGPCLSLAAPIPLPAGTALPLGSSTTRGFSVRTAQASIDAEIGNNFGRAIKQLNDTLLDAAGKPVKNEAVPGPAGGGYNANVINFEVVAEPFDLIDIDQLVLASFTPGLFPGIPGTSGHTEKFAAEVVTYLELTKGVHTFGVSVGTDRTDVNNDDSYQVFVAANARDFFGLKVGEFERFAPPFVANTRNENTFQVDAPADGIYPFRLVYWQTGLGGNLQWYEILGTGETAQRILLNDSANSKAIKAYRDTNIASATSPYVADASPSPGSDGNSASAPIEALLVDGTNTVAVADVKLSLNGTAVVPQTLAKNANKITLAYSPNPARADKNNVVLLEWRDSAGTAFSKTWSFGIKTAAVSNAPITGQWDFDNGTLAATIGQALEYLDGAAGETAVGTKFGTTTQLGVPNIAGKEAKIMEVPGDLTNKIGYLMKHGIAPNGGGTRVNQFTIIMDVLVGDSGPGAASLLQVSSLNNTDDGDLFWQGSNFGQGAGGYNGTGAFTPGEWHRVVAAYDMAATPPVVAKFVDGIKQDDWTANQGLDNPRRALLAAAILFGDGDQDERRSMWVNAVQIRAGRLTDAQAVSLGGPSAAGIAQEVATSSVTGQWDFDRGDLGATIGKPLEYLDGAEGETKTGTVFGTCTALGVAKIGGQDALIMKVPGELSNKLGYLMNHGIAPNGGGTRVNQYTIIFDVLIGDSGAGAASMLQISSLNNTDDGDLFWQGSNFGQGTSGYVGTDIFIPGEWHRVVAAYDMAAATPVVTKYVDGIKQDDWTANQGLDNPRRALLASAILFADGDQDERREWWVNSVQIRPGKMTDAEIEALGGPSAAGIPLFAPTKPATALPALVIGRASQANSISLAYPADAGVIVESSLDLRTWTTATGVGPTATIEAKDKARFYRLRRP